MAGRESAAVQSALAAHSKGLSVLAAARKFGCSPASIHRAKRRRGLPHARPAESRTRAALRDHLAGMSVKDAAAKHDCEPQSIRDLKSRSKRATA